VNEEPGAKTVAEGPRRRRQINLRKSLFVLPSLITLSSVFCGFDAIRIAATSTGPDDFYKASLLIVFAMFFDMLDGRVARMTKTQSAFGLQIDSLADIVSFGVAPAIVVYQWSLKNYPTAGLLASFAFVACGAIRLARFNVLSMGESGKPSKPGKYIVGLPIPGAAGILISIVVANHAAGSTLADPTWSWAVLGLTLLLAFLMVSTIPFRSFKDIKLNVWTALLVLFVIGSSAIVWSRFKPAFVLVWLLGVYVVIGIIEGIVSIPRRLRARRDPEVPPAP
jgi:CDP-diacylglycerol--serine O-phosphatidyltransferase